ncbi:hypothetical protein [Marinoscillum furvescens]|uniref:Polyketide cyclase/dehydrase/lipid transport protein n=1 Tax=Marinoscillum furvescens DSM 4134 TaxID=1122208 RepID=A0A3D9L523_MARFU|nr:hypothetical protein [Marinoscillum furvescens]RED98020.1 hypothetical protein C7460_111162 [Marinoscillum furvescens DSM 4134]
MSYIRPKVFLSQAQFTANHSIGINANPATTFSHLQELDFHHARITSWLFSLRKIQVPSALTAEGLAGTGFHLLENIPNHSLTLGLIGQFWKKEGNLQKFNPDNFDINHTAGFAKATWTFQLLELPSKKTLLTLQTRVQCMDENSLERFRKYWWLVKWISNFTRRELLLTLKQTIEKKN